MEFHIYVRDAFFFYALQPGKWNGLLLNWFCKNSVLLLFYYPSTFTSGRKAVDLDKKNLINLEFQTILSVSL